MIGYAVACGPACRARAGPVAGLRARERLRPETGRLSPGHPARRAASRAASSRASPGVAERRRPRGSGLRCRPARSPARGQRFPASSGRPSSRMRSPIWTADRGTARAARRLAPGPARRRRGRLPAGGGGPGQRERRRGRSLPRRRVADSRAGLSRDARPGRARSPGRPPALLLPALARAAAIRRPQLAALDAGADARGAAAGQRDGDGRGGGDALAPDREHLRGRPFAAAGLGVSPRRAPVPRHRARPRPRERRPARVRAAARLRRRRRRVEARREGLRRALLAGLLRRRVRRHGEPGLRARGRCSSRSSPSPSTRIRRAILALWLLALALYASRSKRRGAWLAFGAAVPVGPLHCRRVHVLCRVRRRRRALGGAGTAARPSPLDRGRRGSVLRPRSRCASRRSASSGDSCGRPSWTCRRSCRSTRRDSRRSPPGGRPAMAGASSRDETALLYGFAALSLVLLGAYLPQAPRVGPRVRALLPVCAFAFVAMLSVLERRHVGYAVHGRARRAAPRRAVGARLAPVAEPPDGRRGGRAGAAPLDPQPALADVLGRVGAGAARGSVSARGASTIRRGRTAACSEPWDVTCWRRPPTSCGEARSGRTRRGSTSATRRASITSSTGTARSATTSPVSTRRRARSAR